MSEQSDNTCPNLDWCESCGVDHGHPVPPSCIDCGKTIINSEGGQFLSIGNGMTQCRHCWHKTSPIRLSYEQSVFEINEVHLSCQIAGPFTYTIAGISGTVPPEPELTDEQRRKSLLEACRIIRASTNFSLPISITDQIADELSKEYAKAITQAVASYRDDIVSTGPMCITGYDRMASEVVADDAVCAKCNGTEKETRYSQALQADAELPCSGCQCLCQNLLAGHDPDCVYMRKQ